MSKYERLKNSLIATSVATVNFSFKDLASIVGGLPLSAYKHRAWWANESDGRHVQTRGWMDAGFIVDTVDLDAQTVRFVRADAEPEQEGDYPFSFYVRHPDQFQPVGCLHISRQLIPALVAMLENAEQAPQGLPLLDVQAPIFLDDGSCRHSRWLARFVVSIHD